MPDKRTRGQGRTTTGQNLLIADEKTEKATRKSPFQPGNTGLVSESYCKSALEITIFWISVVPS